jgi:hypothetical protein
MAEGYRAGFDSWQEKKGFLFFHSVQSDSGAHLESYPMGTGDTPGTKLPGHEADHSLAPST